MDMDVPPLDGDEYIRWRTEADRALQGAKVQAADGLYNWACFAAEQAAQLAFKGILHGIGHGPWGHDLVNLGKRIGEAGVQPPDVVTDALARLGRHYIPARYPDAHSSGPPGDHYVQSDWNQAAADADQILGFADDLWRQLNKPTQDER